jgi:hypothetical protein
MILVVTVYMTRAKAFHFSFRVFELELLTALDAGCFHTTFDYASKLVFLGRPILPIFLFALNPWQQELEQYLSERP